mmetsp:Transcript_33889/g.93004  ORF Transcript_33889/g.93004 Transcript_33889/m.93004 type:complete len:242 (-) Transcript_33889:544-1269(-)
MWRVDAKCRHVLPPSRHRAERLHLARHRPPPLRELLVTEALTTESALRPPLALLRLLEEEGQLEMGPLRARSDRRVVDARLEHPCIAWAGAVLKVALGADDAHRRRRLVGGVGGELDDGGVLDEVKVLRVLVHVEAGALEGGGALPKAVRVEELDDRAVRRVHPSDQLLLHRGEAIDLLARHRQQRVRDQQGVEPLLLGIMRLQHFAVGAVAPRRRVPAHKQLPIFPMSLQVRGAARCLTG